MTNENIKKIHQLVITSAARIDGKLPDHPKHPRGRIPVAHIYDVIKRVMGLPCKQCSDDRMDDIIKIIEFCGNNPDEPHCASALRPHIKPQEIVHRATLDQWFEF